MVDIELVKKRSMRKRRGAVCSLSLCFTVCFCLVSLNLFQGWLAVDLLQIPSAVVEQPPALFQLLEQSRERKKDETKRVVDANRRSAPSHEWSMMETEPHTFVASDRKKPRVFILHDEEWTVATTVQRTAEPMEIQTTRSTPSQAFVLPFERPFYRECELQYKWTTRPTCNKFHEFSLLDFVDPLSFRGSWRSVWNYESDIAVLKQLHFHRTFDAESYDLHTIDALTMERLTSSAHVASLYGFCGPSVITESATGSSRLLVKDTNFTSYQRLAMGRNISQGLADVHAAGILHRDINMANVLNVDGHLKLNDFNIGIQTRISKSNHSLCPVPVRFAAPMWRAPEEIRNTSYVDGPAADVYGLGNLLFQILTRRQPWTHLEPYGKLPPAIVAERKLQGLFPNLPVKYSNATSCSRMLTHAIAACWKINPTERPTAAHIVRVMDQALRFIEKNPEAPIGLPSADGSTLFDTDGA